MRQIVFRQQARRELDDAGDWYEQERIGLGLEFFAEIERCCIALPATLSIFPFCIAAHAKPLHADFLTVFISAREISVGQTFTLN